MLNLIMSDILHIIIIVHNFKALHMLILVAADDTKANQISCVAFMVFEKMTRSKAYGLC